MPYENVKELPDDVRDALPEGAQKIYKEAFNSAWKEYDDPEDRRGNQSREEVASKIAWSAVKNDYEKVNGEWKQK